jgi:hypothetical protein
MKMKRKILSIILFWAVIFPLHAQLPGGVGSPALWFQTVGSGSLLSGNYRWQDFSGDSLRLNIYDSRGAGYGEEYTNSAVRFYNGHPALELNKLLDLRSREVELKHGNLSQATVIGVFAPSASFDAGQLLYGLNGRPGAGVFVGTDKVYPSRESGKTAFDYGETEGMDLRYSSSDSEPDADAFRETSLRIATYYRSLPPATGLWGERSRAVLTFNTSGLTGNVNHNSTFTIPLLESRQFAGYIPEIIVYPRLLTPLERRKIDACLAVKYGISLPVSYIGSRDELLWDCAAFPDYNHRITALYRDDASGLYQRESATSYEEKPHYSDQITHDYYYLANPANRSSASRLLVIGREDGNSLPEGGYLFWGDNNATTSLNSTPWTETLKRMERQWLVKTNMLPAPQPVTWETENLEFSTSGFVSTVTKSGGNAPDQGTAVTALPLTGSSGYLGVDNFTLTGGLTLRFGTQSASYSTGSHDYGYFIDSDYRVYKIEQGVKAANSFMLLILTTALEVEKTDGNLYLRVNGTRLSESEINISPQDRSHSFYGAIAVTKSLVDTRFTLREGGFSDTGERVELSYACAPGFESRENEKAVLVIDRSGSGEFQTADLEFIPADGIDRQRQKVIFHNVFFDRDGNGTDVFTFAYGNPDMLGNLQIIPPDCGESNGEFILKLDWGIRGYNYALTDSATNAPVRNGWEGSRRIHVTDLPTGAYKLTVAEAGGYTFESSAPAGTPLRAKTTNFLPVFEGSIPWIVSNTSDTYGIGYTTFIENISSPDNIIHYGLKKAGDLLYKLEGSKQTLLNTTVAVGDRLRIAKSMSKVTYYQNDEEIGSSSIGILDYLLKFYGLIDFSYGPAEVLNVDAAGFFNLVDYRWETMEGVTAAKAGSASKQYEISLPNGCDPNDVSLSLVLSGSNDRLRISPVPGTLTLQVELTLDVPSPVCFLAYDLKGIPVDRKEIAESQGVARAELRLPSAGVYIIKAITAGEEYTGKTIVR